MSDAKRPKKVAKEMHAALSGASNGFTVDLYRALPQQQPLWNVVFSGLSVHIVVGMIAMGAEGETWTQILKGLRFSANQTGGGGGGDASDHSRNLELGGRYSALIKSLKAKATGAKPPITVLSANKAYVHSGYHPNPNYVAALQNHFQSEIERMDLSTPEKRKQAAARINSFVKAETQNKIGKIIDGPIHKDTRLLLINALYFKGNWEDPFKPVRVPKEFHVTASRNVKVPMMKIIGRYDYVNLKDLNAEAVRIPYKGGKMSMIIILPNKVGGLKGVQDSLEELFQPNYRGKSMITREMEDELVSITMPKFKIESTIDNLVEILTTLGMKNMFSKDDANFGGMQAQSPAGIMGMGFPSEPLYVSEVVQMAFIDVTETGTEAAAVTRVHMHRKTSAGTPPPRPKQFNVNRPFIFQIVDHSNEDLVLFAGHCTEPRAG